MQRGGAWHNADLSGAELRNGARQRAEQRCVALRRGVVRCEVTLEAYRNTVAGQVMAANARWSLRLLAIRFQPSLPIGKRLSRAK